VFDSRPRIDICDPVLKAHDREVAHRSDQMVVHGGTTRAGLLGVNGTYPCPGAGYVLFTLGVGSCAPARTIGVWGIPSSM
jgi:hypothetical protein